MASADKKVGETGLVLRLGAILLSVWFGLNLLLAAGILVAMTIFSANAPALRVLLDETSVAAVVSVQTLGFVSDSFVHHRNLAANLVSTTIMLSGLFCTGISLMGVATVTRPGVAR